MAAKPSSRLESGIPDEAARALYLAILAEGGRISRDDVAEADWPALDQLLAVGLLIFDRIDSAYLAVSPREVSERIGADLRGTATRMLLRAEELPGELSMLTRAYEAAQRPPGSLRSTSYVEGLGRIRHRIAELLSESKRELLTVQPGPRPPDGIALSLQQDLAFVQRGGSLRTLYQPMVLDEPATVGYAMAVTAHGAAIRVLDEPLDRMLVIDRSVAVIPAAEDNSRAAFIEDPAAVAFLVRAFDRDWSRAETVHWGEIPDPQHRIRTHIARLLAQGLTQRAVASRLGLSERTVAGHIARLRELHGAETLFQLGWVMRGE